MGSGAAGKSCSSAGSARAKARIIVNPQTAAVPPREAEAPLLHVLLIRRRLFACICLLLSPRRALSLSLAPPAPVVASSSTRFADPPGSLRPRVRPCPAIPSRYVPRRANVPHPHLRACPRRPGIERAPSHTHILVAPGLTRAASSQSSSQDVHVNRGAGRYRPRLLRRPRRHGMSSDAFNPAL